MATEQTPLVYGTGGGHAELDGDRRIEDSKQNCMSDCIKSFVFGGFDGIVAALAILSGAAGGNLSWRTVLVLGLSSILANAISLGISEFLSSKAHREFLKAEKRRELWEFKNYREVEILEMVNRFEARGMERKDAELVVGKMAQYESFFVGLMVAEELGLQLPDDDDAMLLTDALIMCLSFGLFGCIPLGIFCMGPWNITSQENLYVIAVSVSLVLLCVLAAIKSSFSSATIMHSAVEAVSLGAVCCGLAYAIGAGVMHVLSA